MSTVDSSAAAEAFEAEAGVAPTVVNPDADASIATPSTNAEVPSSKVYTEDDLNKARKQEKDKLYSTIEELKSEVQTLRQRDDEKLAEQQAKKQAEEAEKAAKLAEEQARAEKDMDVRDLLEKKTQELEEQLERERQERERAFALWEREKNYAELSNFKQQILEAERDNIIPELLDLVSGDTPEEVTASIENLKERSARILDSAQQAMQSARREMKGTSITTPPTGPLDINSEQRTLTAQEIAAMPMNEYAKYRQRLLSDKAQGRGQGLFGN
jgi:DNA repair exonuclease SbcCD ATPase subunit